MLRRCYSAYLCDLPKLFTPNHTRPRGVFLSNEPRTKAVQSTAARLFTIVYLVINGEINFDLDFT